METSPKILPHSNLVPQKTPSNLVLPKIPNYLVPLKTPKRLPKMLISPKILRLSNLVPQKIKLKILTITLIKLLTNHKKTPKQNKIHKINLILIIKTRQKIILLIKLNLKLNQKITILTKIKMRIQIPKNWTMLNQLHRIKAKILTMIKLKM